MSTQKPETKYYTSIHKELKKGFPEVYYEKMSNPYRGGTPDVYYEGPGTDRWIEYKWDPKPKNGTCRLYEPNEKPSLSKLQQKWVDRAHKNGRRVGVIVGSPLGGIYLEGCDYKHDFYYCDVVWLPKHTKAELIARLIT